MEIATERLVLRDFSDADAASFAAYHEDPRYATYYAPGTAGAESARELVARFRAWAEEEPRRNVQLAIAERAAPGVVIGSVGVRGAGHPDDVAEFGVELAPAVWGRGYATEASRAILGFAFREMRVLEVLARTVSGNERVSALLRRLGFEPFGTRVGDAWMRAAGWEHADWHLTRVRWTSYDPAGS